MSDRKPPWTGKQLAALREMANRGCKDAEIADAVKRPASAVRAMRERLQIRTREAPPAFVWVVQHAESGFARVFSSEGKVAEFLAKQSPGFVIYTRCMDDESDGAMQ